VIYVIDASVALKWFLKEQESQTADSLLEAFLGNEVELLAPDVLMLEVANTLWKRCALLKQLRSEEVMSILHDFLTLPLNFHASNPLLSRALELSIKVRHPVYDMLYCVLAEENDCEFVTADRVLVEKLRGTLPFVRNLTTVAI